MAHKAAQMPKARTKPRKRALFGRAILPPERFHTTKRGRRGYARRVVRQEEREAMRQASEQ